MVAKRVTCARVSVRRARARSRGLPRAARAWLRARAQGAGFDAAAHHEAGPSVQMMRVRFCLEAAEKPSYPTAYGILAMRMSTFLLLLSYVVWPRHMMVRRATSARGGVLGPVIWVNARRRDGRGGVLTVACWGGCPLAPRACHPRRASRTRPVRTLAGVRRLRHPEQRWQRVLQTASAY